MRDTAKTTKAIENLERMGQELGYSTKRYYSLKNMFDNFNGHKHIDVCFFKGNELKLAIEVETGICKKRYENDVSKFNLLKCKCILLSRHATLRMTSNLLEKIINSDNRIEHINRKWLLKESKKRNILNVVKALIDNPNGFSSISELARYLEVNPAIVWNALMFLKVYVNFNPPKIYEGTTLDQVTKFIDLKEQLKSIKESE